MSEPAEAVLDSSAVLALLNDEPGAELVEPLLGRAAISAANLCETAGKLIDRGMPGPEARVALDALGLAVHPFDEDSAYAAAGLRRVVGSSFSLGDRACLALAHRLRVPAVTSDAAWGAVDLADLTVRVIR